MILDDPVLCFVDSIMAWWRVATCTAWLIAAASSATADDSAADEVFDTLLERAAFGSCSKQHRVELQTRVWSLVAATQPQAWLWTGDAVYAQNHSLASLQNAFAQQTAVPSYREFVASGVKVDGVWGECGIHCSQRNTTASWWLSQAAAYLMPRPLTRWRGLAVLCRSARQMTTTWASTTAAPRCPTCRRASKPSSTLCTAQRARGRAGAVGAGFTVPRRSGLRGGA